MVNVKKLIGRANPEMGLHFSVNKNYHFILKRHSNDIGSKYYSLANKLKKQQISIPYSHFERFRFGLKNAYQKGLADFKITCELRTYNFYANREKNTLTIVVFENDIPLREHNSLEINLQKITEFINWLFHKDLQHPNDLLSRIITYHKLFQLSFDDSSESIKSDLSIRKNLLYSIEDYLPKIDRDLKNQIAEPMTLDSDGEGNLKGRYAKPGGAAKGSETFKPKLGKRYIAKEYAIDYSKLFSGQKSTLPSAVKVSNKAMLSDEINQNRILLSTPAEEIKRYQNGSFSSEFSNDEFNDIRDSFLLNNSEDFFMGFEILEAVFRQNSKLKSFMFPLYYAKVAIRLGNRKIYIDPLEGTQIYFNHIALINLIERFTGENQTKAMIESFLKTLLTQTIQVKSINTNIHLTRSLPIDDEYFSEVREILLGKKGESGKGGLLGKLNVLGIEADLDSVFLYKSKLDHLDSATYSLDTDLNYILNKATYHPSSFNRSLLGRILNSELSNTMDQGSDPLGGHNLMPSYPPRSSRNLFKSLQKNNLIVIEGPPGTGKTHAIRNIFIDAICRGKKVLMVSDKEAAITALNEKLIDYSEETDNPAISKKSLRKIYDNAVICLESTPASGDPNQQNLKQWLSIIRDALPLNSDAKDLPTVTELLHRAESENIRHLDDKINMLKRKISGHCAVRNESKHGSWFYLPPFYQQPTSIPDIENLVSFINFLQNKHKLNPDAPSQPGYAICKRYFHHYETFKEIGFKDALSLFDPKNSEIHLSTWKRLIQALIHKKFVSSRQLRSLVRQFNCGSLGKEMNQIFHKPRVKSWRAFFRKGQEFFDSFIAIFAWKHRDLFSNILEGIEFQIQLNEFIQRYDSQDTSEHHSLATSFFHLYNALKNHKYDFSVHNLFARHYIISSGKETPAPDVPLPLPDFQKCLGKLKEYYQRRDKTIKDAFMRKLSEIAERNNSTTDAGTDNLTRIEFLLQQISSHSSIDQCTQLHEELKSVLLDSFPIWIVRKQSVPLVLPCLENSFDVVIVDEATQCRVDDAFPLLYRAKKFLVVGDDKQTVLERQSIVDDYLFKEFKLSQHLIGHQAHGIKGGGSHIFGFIKNIKQASIFLDEHYRCPPEIVSYSNKYVYDSKLRIMQWRSNHMPSAVTVDFSEQKYSGKSSVNSSGKFKGIDTAMIDRFLDYIAKEIAKIEKENGRRIDVEKDVAICTFLVKNSAYFDEVKSNFLAKLGRGNDVLYGAGAKLQGKERDYIFYFWDCYRGNFGSFRQGDDPNKRRGELNVLMTRPKKKAFHFIHRDFDKLSHGRSTITDYLWQTYHRQMQKSAGESQNPAKYKKRVLRPSHDSYDSNRGSGQLLLHLITYYVSKQAGKKINLFDYANLQFSVIVGSPENKIDMIISPKGKWKESDKSLAIVDMGNFRRNQHVAQTITDYYFQLGRVNPPLEPVFLYTFEIGDKDSKSYQKILRFFSALTKNKDIKTAS